MKEDTLVAEDYKKFLDEPSEKLENSIGGIEHDEIASSTSVSRRGVLGLTGITVALGAAIPFARNFPRNLVPAAYAQTEDEGMRLLAEAGKDKRLVILGDRPLVAETPEHLLNEDTTPTAKFFVRNNGYPPDSVDEPDGWTLTIEGEVDTTLRLTLAEIKDHFEEVTYRMVLECGGNGRAFFDPQARGNQWSNGGAGCAEWTGCRLKDVLEAAGIKSSALYTAHYGADTHLSGNADVDVISRGVPIAKALEEHTLIVWGMNGEDLPAIHGGPLRLLVPGWPASASQKWLQKIVLRDVEHDGAGMTGTSYRLPETPMIPGSEPEGITFSILESMPVRSIISAPTNGTRLERGVRTLSLRGAAWAGDQEIAQVHASIDFGASWVPVMLEDAKNRYDWRRWTADVVLPAAGYYEIWSRATDDNGIMQPHIAGNWNPKGYGGNAMHRIAVLAS